MKIKSIDEIVDIINNLPKYYKIVMVHGVFDIVHPGHIRHLEYAKSKGDILIASLTIDKHIAKGEGRPYIPQELRAKNLSVLEMVDYVIIDENSTPIENIKRIKPDYFIKGFEYNNNNPKTIEEEKTISSYGGEILFSPGDIVYSSTQLLNIHKPKISIDKLLVLMNSENITFSNILDVIHNFKDIKVHVIGDTIIDKYNYCSMLGSTTKTPTFSVKLENSKLFLGGAGIVAKHLSSLGANVTFTSIIGNDDLTDFVLDDLENNNINSCIFFDDTRPTTLKERFWCDGYKLLQVDTIDNSIISDKIFSCIIDKVGNIKSDIVIFSDFRHGIFNKQSIKLLSNSIPLSTLKVADSQVSNRWGNILDFKNFDILFPNEKEARFALGDQDTGIRPLGKKLYKLSKSKNLILKLGEKGIITYRDNYNNPRDFFTIDSFVNTLIDPNGAGDAMLAVTTLTYKVSNNILISSILGSIGAAIECEKEGNQPITIDEIESKIKELMNG